MYDKNTKTMPNNNSYPTLSHKNYLFLANLTIHTKMTNSYFQFKQFTIWHDKCAMKVGTDGVLLSFYRCIGNRLLRRQTGHRKCVTFSMAG